MRQTDIYYAHDILIQKTNVKKKKIWAKNNTFLLVCKNNQEVPKYVPKYVFIYIFTNEPTTQISVNCIFELYIYICYTKNSEHISSLNGLLTNDFTIIFGLLDICGI